jgi:hypothetical protein
MKFACKRSNALHNLSASMCALHEALHLHEDERALPGNIYTWNTFPSLPLIQRRRWLDNIKIRTGLICLRTRTFGGGGALLNAVMNLRVPCHVGKFLSSCTSGDISWRAQLHGVTAPRTK